MSISDASLEIIEDHPSEPCCICNAPVCTIEDCPDHPEGCELLDGRWVCSSEHFEAATEEYNDGYEGGSL